MQEIKRTRNSKHYLRPDGKIEVYLNDIHYHDGNGWQEIIENWEYEPGFGHKVKRAGYNLRILPGYLRFGFAPGVYVDYKLPAGTRTVSGRNLTISDAWVNSDLEYTNGPSGVKAEIVLKAPGHPAEFRFGAYTKNCEMAQVGQEVVFTRQGDIVGRVLAPFAIDASGDVGPVDLRLEGNDIIFTPDPVWLSTATYPVRIDPTTTLQPEAAASKDAYVWQTNGSTNYGTNTALFVGTHPIYSTPFRSYLQFDISSIQGDITNITLQLYAYYVTGAGPQVSAYLPSTTWDEAAITWGNQPAIGSKITGPVSVTATGTWYNFDLTPVATTWKTANNGIVLKQDPEGGAYTYAGFYSSDYSDATLRPKLVITYTAAVIDAVVGPAPANGTATAVGVNVSGSANTTGATASATAQALAPAVVCSADITATVAEVSVAGSSANFSGQAVVAPGFALAAAGVHLPQVNVEAIIQAAIMLALATCLAPTVAAFAPKKKSPAYSWRVSPDRYSHKELPDRWVVKVLPDCYTWKELS
ncbi:hypothetical protein CTH_2244 [Carboxydocella thermautotrophica]|nr:hypothetical protein CTH_2244 [Carboxydocella thermautotrophica]